MSMFWSEHDMMVPVAADLVDRDLERALALGDRHREELALLAADEHAVDAEIVDPVAQVAAQAGLVDGEVGRKRRQRGRPDALEVRAGVVLGVASAVFHGVASLRRDPALASYLIRLATLSTIGRGVA